MSRRTKSFQIEGIDKEIEVRELTVKQIIRILASDERVGKDGTKEKMSIEQQFKESFLPIASNVVYDDLMDMTPSEIKQIYDEFEEINKVFFDVARKAGLEVIVKRLSENIRQVIINDFSALRAKSLPEDIPESGTTDIPTS